MVPSRLLHKAFELTESTSSSSETIILVSIDFECLDNVLSDQNQDKNPGTKSQGGLVLLDTADLEQPISTYCFVIGF
jgi:hypothetical protein